MDAAEEALTRWDRLRASTVDFGDVWLQIEETQQQSLAARKKLAEDTKAFKRLQESEKLSSVPDLLKSYQGEIDSLLKRSKFAETNFRELLKALQEAPEPNIVREAFDAELQALRAANAEQQASQSAAKLDEQLRHKDAQVAKLSAEVRDLEEELRGVKNQAVTVRRLQQEAKDFEAATDAKIVEAQRLKDEEWGRRLEEVREELTLQRDQQMEQRALREDEIERLRRQRLEEQTWAEQAVMARSVEVDALSGDIERLQADLERERSQRAESGEAQGSVKVLQSLLDGVQQRAAALEREGAELRRQLSQASESSRQSEEKLRKELHDSAGKISDRDAEIRGLQEQLSVRPSFDEVAELRQQLRNVEAVDLADVNAASSDLERRLLLRQKTLEGQLSEGRVQIEELQTETETLHRKLQAAEDNVKDLHRLVARLESELGSGSSCAEEKVSNLAPLETLLPVTAPAGGDPLSSTLSATGAAVVSEATRSAASEEAMPSMLAIVTGQRDRLRERAGDLEQDRDRWKSTAEHERKRADMLKQDNIKLLERARYLQSYQPKQGGGGGRRGRSGKIVDTDLEGRYGAAYEEGLDPTPFEQFRQDEKARRVANMSAGERLLVTLGMILFSSKPARLFTLVYASTLHLLVFLVLWRLAHKSC